jgi:hypothetical protein
VATAFEVDVVEARKAGLLGVLSLGLGTILPFNQATRFVKNAGLRE